MSTFLLYSLYMIISTYYSGKIIKIYQIFLNINYEIKYKKE